MSHEFQFLDERNRVEQKCGEIFCKQNNFIIICDDCNSKHVSFKDFVEHFKRMHILVKNKRNINEHHKENVTRTRSSRKQPKNPSFDETSFECVLFEETESSTHVVLDHEEAAHKSDDTSRANACTSTLEDTLLENKFDINQQVEKNVAGRPNTRQQIQLQLQKLHSCKKCDLKFESAHQLKQHRLENHKNIRNSTKNASNAEVNDAVKCTHCGRSYKDAIHLREHMQIHDGTKNNFRCFAENCGKTFKNMALLRRHRQRHEQHFKHVCELCGYRARQNCELARHLRSHTGERPFPCPICGKHFISKPMVKEHQATHAVERHLACDVCGKTFSRPKSLYHHKHLHLDVKKFVCRICDKAYSQAAGLSAHMRQHKIDGKIVLG